MKGWMAMVAAGAIGFCASAATAADIDVAQARAELVGTWLGTYGDQERRRTLAIADVAPSAGGFTATGQYGYTDGKPTQVSIAMTADPSGYSLTFHTASGTDMTLKRDTDHRLVGTGVTAKSSSPLAFDKIAAVADYSLGLSAQLHTGAPAPTQTCKNGSTPDNVHWLYGAGYCLAAKTYAASNVPASSPIVVVIHADNGGRMGNKFEKIAEKIAKDFHVIAVALLRPGYRRSESVTSEGTAHSNDDDYSRENVDIIAGTLASLRATYPGRKVLLVGSSGGSALSALVLDIHPHAADGAVLAGCPCDIAAWRAWRNTSVGNDMFWSRSLSPKNYVETIPADTVLIALNGADDSNTLPKFAKAFVDDAAAHGVAQARFFTVPKSDHYTVINTPEFYGVVGEAIDRLSRP